jgi:Sulfotransferase family
MRYFFVVGCPRSGTTMLRMALTRHSQIVIPPETEYFTSFLGHTLYGQRAHLRHLSKKFDLELPLPRRPIRCGPEAVAFYQDLADAYVRRVKREGVSHFGDKSPTHMLRLPRIRALFPDAPIILIYRDGRDVALSCSRTPWSPPDLYVNFAIWLRYYRWQVWARQHLGGPLLFVKYESLVSDPERQLREVAQFLGLSYEPGMAEGRGNREGVPDRVRPWGRKTSEPIDASRREAWRRELTPEQLRHLERWGRTPLLDLGYELLADGRHPLPWWFWPRLIWKHGVWRAHCAWHLLGKELFGAPTFPHRQAEVVDSVS